MAVKINIFLLSVFVAMHVMHAHSVSLSHKQDTDAEKNRVEETDGKLFGNLKGKNVRNENLPLSTVNTQDNITANFPIFNLSSSIRKKRGISDNSNKPFPNLKSVNGNTCKRHPFEVKFSDLEIDWILEPESVDIGICKGSCTAKDAPVASNNAELRRLAYNFNLISEEEATCCGPTAFRPLSIIYRGEDGLPIRSIISDFSISECGCF